MWIFLTNLLFETEKMVAVQTFLEAVHTRSDFTMCLRGSYSKPDL